MSDVLIVGAGSAGSILAERLSADPSRRVTLIEAGLAADDPTVHRLTTDGLTLPIAPGSPVARHYRAALTATRETDIVRGYCVGGSGAVNGGYFCREAPGREDLLPGWSPAQIDAHHRAVATDLDFPEFGGHGPIPVRRIVEFGSPTQHFLDAAHTAGHRWVADLNTGQTGVGAVPLNVVDGVRTGPAAAFLAPALRRTNLTVLTATSVTRVRVGAHRVLGVDVVTPRGAATLDGDRVVLCAGAIATAQLLMLSGIGPAQDLRALGIPVVADLPVGRRSRDHPEWLLPTGWPAAEQRPALEVVLVTDVLEIRPYSSGFGRPTTEVGVALMAPRGHGRVTLRSVDPATAPRIEYHYDSEPLDIADLQEGARLAADLIGGACAPGDRLWSTSQHLCGTAPMGTEADEHAVVDPRCRVRGVDGLFVIDGSVLPRIPHRGPHATIAMVAHRAAEFV